MWIAIGAIILLIALFHGRLTARGRDRLTKLNLQIDDVVVLLGFAFIGYRVGMIFYRIPRLAAIAAIFFTYGVHYYRKWKQNRLHRQMIDEFIEINRMLISELHAGKSLQRAYRDIYLRIAQEGERFQPNMQAQLKIWCQKMDMGMEIGEILQDFANCYRDDNIAQFVNMVEVAQASGSSLLDVIDLTDRMIGETIEIERELAILIAEKKLEQIVVSASPVLLLYIMQQFSYDFVAPLYETAVGRLLMTGALVVFIGCFIWSKRMTEIEP